MEENLADQSLMTDQTATSPQNLRSSPLNTLYIHFKQSPREISAKVMKPPNDEATLDVTSPPFHDQIIDSQIVQRRFRMSSQRGFRVY